MRRTHLISLVAIFALFAGLLSAAGAETRVEKSVAPGAQYIKIQRETSDGKPLIVHVLKMDRSAKNLSFHPIKGLDHVVGTETPRNMGERLSTDKKEVIATINADFYDMDAPLAGLPCGIIVRDGELMCSPNGWLALGFDKDGNPQASMPKFFGSVLAGGERFAISQVNRPYQGGNEMDLFTKSFGPSTFNKTKGTDVVLTNVKPDLPLRSGVTYTGTVAEVRKDATNDAVPADGVLISGCGTAAAFMDKNLPVGASVTFSASLDPAWSGVENALGGWPVLLHEGKIQDVAPDEYLTKRRHSRTVVGWNDKYSYIIIVDGNQAGSAGMDMSELAKFAQEVGCMEAINLDGGGSSMLSIRGDVVSHPSDGMDRSVSGGWAVTNTAFAGALKNISICPDNISILQGSHIRFKAAGADADGNPVVFDPANVLWSLEGVDASSSTQDPDSKPGSFSRPKFAKGELGSVDNTGAFTAANVLRAGLITATVGDVSGTATINIWDKPARLFVLPAKSMFKAGQKVLFSVQAFDRAGRPMLVDDSAVAWKASGAKIRPDGNLIAPSSGSFTVTATVAGVSVTGEGVVGK